MLRSFIVLFICSVGLSVAQLGIHPEVAEDPQSAHTECGQNEVWNCDPCPLIQTCDDRALDITCSDNQVCAFQCVCKEGFFRRTKGGECIPEIECGPSCGIDEVYTDCKPSCSNDTCSTIRGPFTCENGYEEPQPCKPGCICINGYVRKEENSPCIPHCLCPEEKNSDECLAWASQFHITTVAPEPKEKLPEIIDDFWQQLLSKQIDCGPNEVFAGCVNPCPPEKTCQYRETYLCLDVVVPCQHRCSCKEGFIRKTEGGECIPEKDCGPVISCDYNEVYTDCKPSCSNETCSAIGSPLNCDNKEPCKPGCICREGYVRKEIEDEEDPRCGIPICSCSEMKNSPNCRPKLWNGVNPLIHKLLG